MKPATTTVFSFPMKSPEGSVTRHDMTAIEQLEMWLTYQRHYTDHKPSVTVSVGDDEWAEVGAFVYQYFDEMSGVIFLPRFDHTYAQAPYQDISEEQYEAALFAMPSKIDWSELSKYETEDTTKGSQTLACSSGTCELVDI
jgi:ribonucleoside-diphosphate reductase alpha chain